MRRRVRRLCELPVEEKTGRGADAVQLHLVGGAGDGVKHDGAVEGAIVDPTIGLQHEIGEVGVGTKGVHGEGRGQGRAFGVEGCNPTGRRDPLEPDGSAIAGGGVERFEVFAGGHIVGGIELPGEGVAGESVGEVIRQRDVRPADDELDGTGEQAVGGVADKDVVAAAHLALRVGERERGVGVVGGTQVLAPGVGERRGASHDHAQAHVGSGWHFHPKGLELKDRRLEGHGASA